MTTALEAFRQRVNNSILTERINTPKPKSNLLCHFLPDNIWASRRVFLVGGGPSLRGFDWSRLEGELVIGINRAFEFCNPSMIFSMDARFWSYIEQAWYGIEVTQRFRSYKRGLKVWVDTLHTRVFSDDILLLDEYKGPGPYSPSLSEGVRCGKNSGFAALNVALLLGCSPIYLLGYDMQGNVATGKQDWHHTPHPIQQSASVYAEKFLPEFNGAAPYMMQEGRKIINLNPNSALRCFPTAELESVERGRFPLIIAYYTKGTGYEEEAVRLQNSLCRLGLDNEIIGVENLGSWQQNTQYKAAFIQSMLNTRKRDVLYVDADAVVNCYPDLLETLHERCDFAAHRRDRGNGRRELLSGTLFFRNSTASHMVLNKWQAEMENDPAAWDQVALSRALEKMPQIRAGELPASYCAIFDARMTDAPVIEHFQASRRLKNEVVL